MTDEARIQRLTELARRVWPESIISHERDATSVITGIQRDGERTWTEEPVCIDHPRALDALEAALLVLAQQSPPQPLATAEAGAQHVIADASIPAWVEQLASEWEHQAREPGTLQGTQRPTMESCARELRERARKP